MREVRFGLFMFTDDIADAMRMAQDAEARGFYSVSHNDHFYSPLGTPESPQLECCTVLAAVAAVTKTVRLAPAVLAASFRTPPLLAKIATSLDIASNGRFICGLGAGWQDKEYLAHGYPFPSLGERLEQLDETICILKAMWTEDDPCFDGRHYSVRHAYNNPRAVQQPHPPIMLGGSGTGLLRLAARHADIINLIPPTGNGRDFINDPAATVKFDMPTLVARIAQLHRNCRDIGRDPNDIELGGLCFVGLSNDAADPELRALATRLGFPDYASAQRAPVALLGTPDEVKQELARRIEETGITYYIVATSSPASLDLFSREVMPAFRG